MSGLLFKLIKVREDLVSLRFSASNSFFFFFLRKKKSLWSAEKIGLVGKL